MIIMDINSQGLKMYGSGAARKFLAANHHRKFVTISQEIFSMKFLMLCVNMDIDFI